MLCRFVQRRPVPIGFSQIMKMTRVIYEEQGHRFGNRREPQNDDADDYEVFAVTMRKKDDALQVATQSFKARPLS